MPEYELKPMSIGDILDGTFRLYRARFGPFLLIALTVYIPISLLVTLLQGLSQQAMTPGEVEPGMLLIVLVPVLLFALFVLPLCQGALVHNISAAYLGEDIGAWASYRRAAPRLIRLLIANLIAAIIIGCGFILFIVPGIIFSLWYMLLTAVVMLETKGILGSGKRSRELMRGNLGKGFVLALVVFVLGFIFQMIVSAALAIIGGFTPAATVHILTFVENAAPAVILPIQVAPMILLYYDLRIRKEGFDLERLAASLEEDQNDQDDPYAPPPFQQP